MGTSIGPRIGVDGYDQFRTQMDVITSKLKALENEAAALEKQYSGHTDSLEYLTKKSENYSKQLELQKQRLEESKKWTDSVKAAVDAKKEATDKDALAVAKAEELQSKYNAGLQNTEVEAKKAAEEVDNYGKKLLTSADAAEETEERTSAATVAIGNLISRLVEGAARLGKQMLQTGIRFNGQMESYQAGFETLLGSEEDASAALDNIIATAKRAPTFSLEGLAEANRTLIAAGSSAEEANQQVLDLANALAAAGKGDAELSRMALNLQQIANNGQAFAIDLKQFNSAGIPVWQILADYTGKTKDELSGTVVTFEMLTGALSMAASEGGRYFGALDKQAAKFNGQVNALKNNIRLNLGAAFEGVTQTLETSLLPALNNLFSSEDKVKELTATIEGVGTAIAVIAAEAKLMGIVNSEAFEKSAARVALYKASLDKGTISQAEFTGAMSLSDIAVGLYTGEITAAEAATWMLNTAMSALPFAVVAAGVGLLVTGIKNYKTDVNGIKEKNIIEPESLEEANQHLEEMKARVAELEGIWPEFRTAEQQQEIDGLNAAIKETKVQIEELAAAEQEAAEYAASPEGQLNSVIENAKTKLQELYSAYDEAYASAMEAAQKEFELFEYIEGVSYTSVQDMIAALDSQALYWQNYAVNLEMVRDKNYGLTEDLIAFLSDGSQESAGYLQSIINDVNAAGGYTSEGGQAIIRDINESWSRLQSAQGEYADQTARTATDYEKSIKEIVNETKGALDELDLTDEMRQKGAQNLQKFAEGMNLQAPLLTQQAALIGQAIAASLQNGINSVPVSLPSFSTYNPGGTTGGRVRPGFASGLDYVPYDNFPAYLHKGETVLNAAAAARYRSGDNINNTSNKTVNNTVNVYGAEGQNVTELADEVAYRLQDMVERKERAG